MMVLSPGVPTIPELPSCPPVAIPKLSYHEIHKGIESLQYALDMSATI
jgi:hypothetical protein